MTAFSLPMISDVQVHCRAEGSALWNCRSAEGNLLVNRRLP